MPFNPFIPVHVTIGDTRHEFTVAVEDYELGRMRTPSERARGREYGVEHRLREVLEQVLSEVLSRGGTVETLRTINFGGIHDVI